MHQHELNIQICKYINRDASLHLDIRQLMSPMPHDCNKMRHSHLCVQIMNFLSMDKVRESYSSCSKLIFSHLFQTHRVGESYHHHVLNCNTNNYTACTLVQYELWQDPLLFIVSKLCINLAIKTRVNQAINNLSFRSSFLDSFKILRCVAQLIDGNAKRQQTRKC